MQQKNTKTHIVVVGGGAGGLELVTWLSCGDAVTVTLVDASLTHLWKPLLHEVAAGTLNPHEDELNYYTHAHQHGYRFEYGCLQRLDRNRKQLWLAPQCDDDGRELIPMRNIYYDFLVIAIGSVGDDFNVPGVQDYCHFLDNQRQADYFHHKLLMDWIYHDFQAQSDPNISAGVVIVGGGATGVELAAELSLMSERLTEYRLTRAGTARRIKISLIESSPRLVQALPERLSKAIEEQLTKLNIRIHTGEFVTGVTKNYVKTRSGLSIPATIKVWAAGIKAPDLLANLADLETNKRNQLVVNKFLQTSKDSSIFAIGDCASCRLNNSDSFVPPRAQAAHQQAALLARSLLGHAKGKMLLPYHYRDYGSLISLSHNVVGNLMGKLVGNFMIEGWLARMVYLLLYRKHLLAVHGWWRTTLLTLANVLTRHVKPRLKLH